MIVTIDTVAAAIVIQDAGVLNSLKAIVAGQGSLAQALGAYGNVDADGLHVWFDIGKLRELAARGEGLQWPEKFDGMIVYAAKKGWTDAQNLKVRVHIE